MILVSGMCGVLVAGLLLPIASLVGLTTRNISAGFQSLPLELDSEPTPQRTTVLDRNGNVLAYFYKQNRVDVPLSKVAPVMQQAIIAIEDSRFYEHGALDVRGTVRAFINNAADDGSTQGGSSITQQLVKQILVTQAKTKAEARAAVETTYARKLRELQYALAYERSTPSGRSWRATSTSPTSVTAPTASRRPLSTSSPSTRASSTCASRR
jgi:membrane peptidoglycan carboxypeptidase